MSRWRASDSGRRLDSFLAGQLGESRSYCRELILRGCVKVSGARRPPDYRLDPGDEVEFEAPRPEWPALRFESWVLFEDEHVLALDKPSGLLMHPLREHWLRTPDRAAQDVEPNLAGLLTLKRPEIVRSTPRCGIVHRLDRQTSGALIVAKSRSAHELLVAAFAERRVDKIYKAVVLGEFASVGAEVEAPVGRRPGRRRMEVLPWGREARTSFKVVDAARGVALVEARPLTGRTHQIRVHLAELKHPVLGDPEWIGKSQARQIEQLDLPPPPRLMLHAYRLSVPHPATGKPLRLTAPLPVDFKAYWKKIKLGR